MKYVISIHKLTTYSDIRSHHIHNLRKCKAIIKTLVGELNNWTIDQCHYLVLTFTDLCCESQRDVNEICDANFKHLLPILI